MADMDSLAENGSVSQSISQPSESSQQSATAVSPAPVEKMIPQSQVDKIVGRVRDETRQDAYNKAKAEYQTSQPSQSHLGNIEQMSPDKINQLIEDKIKERTQEEYGKKIVQEFAHKLQSGKDKYSDFDETVAQINLPSIPHIVHWANSLDNTADVIYEISKHPSKFANILMLSQSAPLLAQREMHKLSDSIKKNETAKSQPSIDEPLEPIKHSNVGTDNGSLNVRDLRKQSWLRA